MVDPRRSAIYMQNKYGEAEVKNSMFAAYLNALEVIEKFEKEVDRQYEAKSK